MSRRRTLSTAGTILTVLPAVIAVAAAIVAVAVTYPFWQSGTGAALPPPPATAQNETARLMAMTGGDGQLDAAAVENAFAPIQPRLEDLHVLMVPSFLADALMPAREAGLADYFNAQEHWLESQGAHVTVATGWTALSASDNADRIAAFVAEVDGPVGFVSHSKGGVDVLTYLVDADPDQLARVRCWIALQPPLGGSPLADAVLADPDAASVSGNALGTVGSSLAPVRDLSVKVRQAFLAERDEDIARIAATVPIIVAAGRFESGTWLEDGFPYTIPRAWLERRGIESDGLVPVTSARLPHAPYVLVDESDHGATIRNAMPLTDDGALFLKALFALLPWDDVSAD